MSKNSIAYFYLLILCLGLNSSLVNSQVAVEIRFQPKDYVYVYETKGSGTVGEFYTAVIQNIAIVNTQLDNFSIKDLEIVALKEKFEMQRIAMPYDFLMESATKYHTFQKQGVLTSYDFQFQTSKYLNGINLSNTPNLGKNEAIIISHRTLLFQSLPDSIKVVVKGTDSKGNIVTSEKSLDIINHTSKNEYYFPLRGIWIAGSAPSLVGHHRWASIQEFAFDFVKLGASGKTYKGSGNKLSDYYSYGAPIYSIGAGEVVSVSNEATESDKNLKQPNETEEQYFIRSMKYQQNLLSKGFTSVLGNHIIIRHEGGEYSHYLHLKKGSIKVKVGDVVNRGEKIAELGHSGNSTEPHLHFHVTDGADMSYSRSIPVTFHNISLYPEDNNIRHIHDGQIIICNE